MINNHLDDITIRKEVNSNCDNISSISEKQKQTEEDKHLIDFLFNTTYFCGLPKVHKSKIRNTDTILGISPFLDTFTKHNETCSSMDLCNEQKYKKRCLHFKINVNT